MIEDVQWLQITLDIEARIYPVGRLDYDTSGLSYYLQMMVNLLI